MKNDSKKVESLSKKQLIEQVEGKKPRTSLTALARISHQLTVEARDRPAITSLRLLTVLNVLFKYARIVQETGR